ncbi:hypothetical protein RDWZM_004106 [Blomia tropicalis]|uniref:Casein kinase substrate phosphoprotein PP28 domain-containing protein n=1 Tax=Blomia tropicalis TaxID=40697 RepID=A0A9Q0RT74_BLOTA|nr:hypothetical protein RDWZM_004106 [Blomia tropicalis]
MRRTKVNRKGKSRHFSTPEEIQAQLHKLEIKDEKNSSEDENSSDENGSSSNSDSESETEHKPKGVSNLIQIENPNRVPKKPAADPSTAKVELSRREREELEKQASRERYQKLHAAGKTDQAKADLARLAIIRQKREEEAQKRREEAKMKEEDAKKKIQQSSRRVDGKK